MRRWCLLVSTSALVFVVGCFGQKSYTERLDHTLARLERERRIAKNLMPAPEEKKYKDLSIYVRPPKDEAQAKTGQLPAGEGQFEVDSSFLDKSGAALHLLGRVKLPKKAPTKGAAPTAAPPPRGEFTRDVLNILTTVYGPVEAFTTPKFVDEKKGPNQFKRLIVAANDKEVKLYTYKKDNHEVALVFAYDPKLRGPLSGKIDLCLETFATGARATQYYSNGGEPEEEDAASSAPVPM